MCNEAFELEQLFFNMGLPRYAIIVDVIRTIALVNDAHLVCRLRRLSIQSTLECFLATLSLDEF